MTGHVLLVEPDLGRRLRLAAQLQAGYFTASVMSRLNPASFLSEARGADAVLLPGDIDGALEALKLLRQDPTSWATPAMVITHEKLGDEALTDWFHAGVDDVCTGAYPPAAFLAQLSALTLHKQGNDRLQQAYTGFCEPLAATRRSYPLQRLDAQPIYDFDPARAEGDTRPSIQGATLITSEEELLSRLLTVPDALVRLDMTNPYSAEVGLRLIPQIRSDAARRFLPILAHVGTGMETVGQTALHIGASDAVFGAASSTLLRLRLLACDRRRYWAAEVQASVLDQLRLSMTDPLSGLNNRRFVERYGPAMLATCAEAGQSCAVLAIDIDRFKAINDSYGHACGDRVISVVARRISRSVRANDLVARVGGEEFLVILPDTGQERALDIAERIRVAISNRRIRTGATGQSVSVTISAGIAMAGAGIRVSQFKSMVETADTALYESKAGGRDRISLRALHTAA